MAAISTITRITHAHAPSSRADRTTSLFTRPRLFVIALFAVIAWLALAAWVGQEKGARREHTLDTPTAAHATQPAHVHR